ncbi:MAG: hypothetical protein MUE96_10715 [Bacteroidia bacterium]|jgi:hypothetical protein|nr:hypothetical protein [Bacteroidia bacterium]
MKKYTILLTSLIFTLSYNNALYAQCDTEIISTNPPPSNTGDQWGSLPPQNKNPERPYMQSTFSWMDYHKYSR